ncbi:MAG: hypothetical protein IT458_14015 [Planctomycetes bacterium]|nr:hypothetical protein [Planctomycetota bacterium]
MAVVRSLGELAEALEVDVATVYRWRAAGMPQAEGGGFDPEQVAAWNRTRVSAANRRGPPALLPSEAVAEAASAEDRRWATEYRKAKALREVMLLQELRGQLIEVDRVEQLLVARALELRKNLLGLGRRLAPVLVGKPIREIQATVDDAITGILEHYAREEGVPRVGDQRAGEPRAAGGDRDAGAAG